MFDKLFGLKLGIEDSDNGIPVLLVFNCNCIKQLGASLDNKDIPPIEILKNELGLKDLIFHSLEVNEFQGSDYVQKGLEYDEAADVLLI